MPIDVDRGVEIRHTSEGIAVYMFADTPGVFYNEHGTEVGPRAAQMAGFSVDDLLLQRRKREAIAKAGEAVAATFKETTREVVKTRGDYSIVRIGADRHNVEFNDGSVMNLNGPLSLSVAENVLDALQPEEETAPVDSEKPEKPAKT